MRLELPAESRARLHMALRAGGTREVGGQLFGEQLAPSLFRVTHLTVQRTPGTFARFVVDIAQALHDAAAFFRLTRHDYGRFNYIGEWHSHPSFAVTPSSTDRDTMRALVTDPDFKGHFAVLMISRLDGDDLTLGAWLFDPCGNELPVTLEHLA